MGLRSGFGKNREMKDKKVAGTATERPLQTPTAGDTGDKGRTDDSKLKVEDVPLSRPQSPRNELTPNVGGGRPGSTATSVDTQKTKDIQAKVDNATQTMEKNIQAATQRGESLTDLQDKTAAVAAQSQAFSKNAKVVKKNLWWKNMKFTIIVTIVIICVLVGVGVLIWLNLKS